MEKIISVCRLCSEEIVLRREETDMAIIVRAVHEDCALVGEG